MLLYLYFLLYNFTPSRIETWDSTEMFFECGVLQSIHFRVLIYVYDPIKTKKKTIKCSLCNIYHYFISLRLLKYNCFYTIQMSIFLRSIRFFYKGQKWVSFGLGEFALIVISRTIG